MLTLTDQNLRGIPTEIASSPEGDHATKTAGQDSPAEEDCGTPSEGELVGRARTGDTSAFAQLIKHHHGSCLKRATMMVRNASDAEDEVQNAYWKAFQCLDQFRAEGSFAAWLGRI